MSIALAAIGLGLAVVSVGFAIAALCAVERAIHHDN